MSLLEDIFLEDEAGEAEHLERVIEGDDYEDVQIQNENAENSDNNSEKEDEAEEDKRRVDPTKPKRIVRNPRFLLNPARLTGPRGIQVIPDHFKDFKFKGKGHETDDLDIMLKRLEHWAYRLYPKFEFSDCLKKIETLGKKKPVMVHLHKIRTDQYISDDIVEHKDSSDDEGPPPQPEEDEFDKLLQQQIELARATPTPMSVAKSAYSTPMPDRSLLMPKATSSPSINDEQRERMLRNRRLAEERRLAKLKTTQASTSLEESQSNIVVIQDNHTENIEENTETTNFDEDSTDIVLTQVPKYNKEVSKFNVNESPDTSDSECDLVTVNRSVVADIHVNGRNSIRNIGIDCKQVTCDNNASESSKSLVIESDFVVLRESVDTTRNVEINIESSKLSNIESNLVVLSQSVHTTTNAENSSSTMDREVEEYDEIMDFQISTVRNVSEDMPITDIVNSKKIEISKEKTKVTPTEYYDNNLDFESSEGPNNELDMISNKEEIEMTGKFDFTNSQNFENNVGPTLKNNSNKISNEASDSNEIIASIEPQEIAELIVPIQSNPDNDKINIKDVAEPENIKQSSIKITKNYANMKMITKEAYNICDIDNIEQNKVVSQSEKVADIINSVNCEESSPIENLNEHVEKSKDNFDVVERNEEAMIEEEIMDIISDIDNIEQNKVVSQSENVTDIIINENGGESSPKENLTEHVENSKDNLDVVEKSEQAMIEEEIMDIDFNDDF